MTMFLYLFLACQEKGDPSPDDTASNREPGSESNTETGTDPSTEPSSEPGAETEPSTEPSSETAQEPSTEPSSEPAAEPTTEPTQNPIEIIGSYLDNTSAEHRITEDSWLIDYGGSDQYYYLFSQYSNSDQYVIAENDANNPPPEPGAWSRFDWYFDGPTLWACQTISNAPSEAAALNTEKPDFGDTDSCRPYGWMRLD